MTPYRVKNCILGFHTGAIEAKGGMSDPAYGGGGGGGCTGTVFYIHV